MKTIAVIFGGRSAEHDISIVTALSSIIKPLELTHNYKIEPIYIAKDGTWYWDEKLKDITLFSSGKVDDLLKSTKPVQLSFDGGLTLTRGGGFSGRKSTSIDIVFPAMHGTYGEDGSLMGLLEMANIPYVGCGLDASVLAMDKVLAKHVVKERGVSVANFVWVDKSTFAGDHGALLKTVEKQLEYPLYVKPAHLGSSIGISRVKNKDEFQNAMEVAMHYDDKVIIESEVQNLIEVTLPIMGNDELTPALLERPLTTAEDFFDFDTKYIRAGGKQAGVKGAQGYSELPAKLDKSLYAKAESAALDAYRALGCSGIARVDLLIDSKTKEVYFNEANPLPGSLYAHNWRASGVSSVELVENLVRLALEKHEKRQQNNTAFSTNFLQQF